MKKAKFTLLDRVKAVFNVNFDEFIRKWMAGNEDNITIHGCEGGGASAETAMKFTAVFSCLRVLGETFPSCPIHEYQKIDDNNREKTDKTGLLDILHTAPNGEMDAFSYWQMGMYQMNTGGNFISFKEKNRYDGIAGLTPIEWERVRIDRDKATGEIVYTIDGREDQKYLKSDIFHILGPSINGIVGLSPIEYASQAVRLGLTYERFANNFFKNGVFTTGVFEHPTHLKEDAFKRLKESLGERYTAMEQKGTPIIAEDGMKFNPIQIKLIDAELLASKKFQVEDICRIYRVPLHLVQNLDKATFSNIEQQSLEFVMYTMLPWYKRAEAAINTQLLSRRQREQGFYFEFNMAGLLRGDQKSMAEAFAIGRQWGWLSVNDIRRMLNLNSIGPAGGIYLQPMNMIEAGKPPPEPKKVDPTIREQVENLIMQVQRS